MRVGLIGTGSIARRHAEALRGTEHTLLHLGTSRAKSEGAAAQSGGEAYATLDELLRTGRPDAVIVTVPPMQHGAIEHCLIDHRIPFLVEKPLSADPETAEDIAEHLAGSALVAAAGYNWRALDVLQPIRAALVDAVPRLVLGEFHVGLPSAPWWRKLAQSGGQFVEQACHLVDLSRLLVGDAVLEAAAGLSLPRVDVSDSDVAPASAALLRYRNGAIGVFTATSLLPRPASVGLRILSEGTQVSIALDGATIRTGNDFRSYAVEVNTYRVQDLAFFKAVEANNPAAVLCTYDDALKTHRLCHAIANQVEALAVP